MVTVKSFCTFYSSKIKKVSHTSKVYKCSRGHNLIFCLSICGKLLNNYQQTGKNHGSYQFLHFSTICLSCLANLHFAVVNANPDSISFELDKDGLDMSKMHLSIHAQHVRDLEIELMESDLN